MALDSLTFSIGHPPLEVTRHGGERLYVFDPEMGVFVDAGGNEVADENLTAHKALELYRARVAAGIVG